jgi:hypothetical protein
MPYLRSLRLFFGEGATNDYRVNESSVEFRTSAGTWRILSDSEIELHFRFNTELARWLRANQVAANPHAS